MVYSLLILIPFLIFVDTFPRFARNSFENRQVAACRFLKELDANLLNVSTNKKSGIACAVINRIWRVQMIVILNGQVVLIRYYYKRKKIK